MAERAGVVPSRVRRSRREKLPPDTTYVGRPTVWGNPFVIGAPHPFAGRPMTRDDVIELYRSWITEVMFPGGAADMRALRGRNLACWCPLDQPCHADVLLEIANSPGASLRSGPEVRTGPVAPGGEAL